VNRKFHPKNTFNLQPLDRPWASQYTSSQTDGQTDRQQYRANSGVRLATKLYKKYTVTVQNTFLVQKKTYKAVLKSSDIKSVFVNFALRFFNTLLNNSGTFRCCL